MAIDQVIGTILRLSFKMLVMAQTKKHILIQFAKSLIINVSNSLPIQDNDIMLL